MAIELTSFLGQLPIPLSTRRALDAHRATPRFIEVLEKLAAAKPIPVEDHNWLRRMGLAITSARGYEIAFAAEREPGKAIGAATSWRWARVPRKAVAIGVEALSVSKDDWEQGRILNVIAAALADLDRHDEARTCCERALELTPPRFRDFPQRTLARIAKAQGRHREATARFEEATTIENHRNRFDHLPEKERILRSVSDEVPPPVSKAFGNYQEAASDFRALYRQDYLSSPHWFVVREQVLAGADGICEYCGAAAPLDVHHLSYERLGHEDIERDLVAICRKCHDGEHDSEERVVRTLALALDGASEAFFAPSPPKRGMPRRP